MGYSSAEIFEFQSNDFQFRNWRENELDDLDYLAHVKKVVSVAFDEELSEKQKLYFSLYFLEGRTISEIANLCGVNKSTVSRTLAVAKKNLARVVRYSAPHLLNAFVTKRNKRLKYEN